MNSRARTARATALVLSLLLPATPAFAGPLDPPVGPVGSTYKTLTEVEPRIAVNSVNTPGDAQHAFIIAAPGSYMLTSDLIAPVGKAGIGIAADGVTLDLNGFSIIGTGDFPTAVGIAQMQGANRNFVIRNGTVRNFGYGMLGGITDSLIENLAVLDNAAGGLNLGSATNSTIRNCRVTVSGEAGILAGPNALIEHCVVQGGAVGISLVLSGVVAECTVTGAGTGIEMFGPGVVRSSSVRDCVTGIRAAHGALVEGCSVAFASQHGVEVRFGSTLRGCSVTSSPIGVRDGDFTFGRSTIDSNTIAECPIGVKLVQQGTTVVRNHFHNCATAAVQAAPGNLVGAQATTPVGAGAWDNLVN